MSPPIASRAFPLVGSDAVPGDSVVLDANDAQGCDPQGKLVVGISASVNPMNRAFVPRPLPDNIDGHLRLARALVANRRNKKMPATDRALCRTIEARLNNIKEAHRRGAAKVGLAGEFFKSAAILANSTIGRQVSATPSPTHQSRIEALPRAQPPFGAGSNALSRQPCTCSAALPLRASPPAMEVRDKPIEMDRLPRDWEHMMDVVEMSWEVGVGTTMALKKLQSGEPDRLVWDKKHPFGRASSSMLSKRRAIAKAAIKAGGWGALRLLLRDERAKRTGRGESFGYNKVQMFCSAMMRET